MSFRLKLTLLNASVVAILLVGIAWILTFVTQRQFLTSLDNDLLMRAERSSHPPPGGPNGPGLNGTGPNARGSNAGARGGPPNFPPSPGPPDGDMGPPDGVPGGQTNPFSRPPRPEDGGMDRPDNDPRQGPRHEQMRGNDDPLRPRYFNQDGTSTGPAGPSEPLDSAALSVLKKDHGIYSTVSRNGGKIRVITFPFQGPDYRLSQIQLGHDLADFDRLRDTQNQLIFALVPIAVLISGVAAWFLTNRALGPVASLTQAAAKITEADLGIRLPSKGQDELAILAQTFNGMLGRLQGSFIERQSLVVNLRAALERQSRFVADASHELKTPLSRIKLTSSAALSQSGDLAELTEALRVTDAAADDMTRLVQQLLLLARAEGDSPAKSEMIDLTALVQKVVANLSGEKEVRIELTLNSSAKILGTPDIERAIANVVENARRYTPLSGRIEISLEETNSTVILEIQDSGIGIAAENLPHLTERFYRADSARDRRDGGSGLGLAITKAIVQRAGGTLEISSQVGTGTNVKMIFQKYLSKS